MRRLTLVLMASMLSTSAFATFSKKQVTVMTQNVYVGADVTRLKSIAQNPNILTVPKLLGDVYQTSVDTQFEKRVGLIADQIAAARPHVVALQEVSLFRKESPGNFVFGNPTMAETVVLDHLDLILKELRARGLDYSVGAMVENADLEVPILAGEGDDLFLEDLRLTDHDVLLVRGDVEVVAKKSGNFTDAVRFNASGNQFVVPRGYAMIDAKVEGAEYRFATSHVEIAPELNDEEQRLQSLQMKELVRAISDTKNPIILLGDFNSSPESEAGSAYHIALESGYADMWKHRFRNAPEGNTCCYGETLDDPTDVLYERIDHVFYKPGLGRRAFNFTRSYVLGDEVDSRGDAGLWPSDHAGLVSHFVFYQRYRLGERLRDRVRAASLAHR